jgi:hypothetical protein
MENLPCEPYKTGLREGMYRDDLDTCSKRGIGLTDTFACYGKGMQSFVSIA